MPKLVFSYPFMLFGRCNCTNQIPIHVMKIGNQSQNKVLRYKLQCPICGSRLYKIIHISDQEIDLTHSINAYKVIPSIKDELCIIKFDTLKAIVRDHHLSLYGNYSHLRFWDNRTQNDVLKINYSIEE